MKPLARIIVKETAGIRRFLYPVSAIANTDKGNREPQESSFGPLNVYIDPPAKGMVWRVSEIDGTLLPSCTHETVSQESLDKFWPGHTPSQSIYFGVSLSPFEQRELLLVETDEEPVIPDLLRVSFDEQNGLTTHQERVSFRVGAKSNLDSVVYDNAEHLAGPLSITIDGEPFEPLSMKFHEYPGLSAAIEQGNKSGCLTHFLTAFKSWVDVGWRPCRGTSCQTIEHTLQLRRVDETPTCDFGFGEGVYEKIAGDAVVWTTEFGEQPYACWRISTVNAGVERIDYQGKYATEEEFRSRAWFHWTEKSKALAVAIRKPLREMELLVVTLRRDGEIKIAATFADQSDFNAFFVCYHFLNDIPAIAAATNPASILLPPEVTIAPL